MSRRLRRIPFRYLEPAFFSGLLDDPVLFVRIRPLGRALLFDCGQIAHLAKRVLKPVDAVFVTHAHMDHIMGIPTLVRHHHASPKPLDIFGPPGVGDRIDHLLQGFDWNLCEPTWCTLHVHEVHRDRIRRFTFPGPEGFRRRFAGEEPRSGRRIWSCRYAAVDAELLDHKLPVLAFRIDEQPHFTVDPQRLVYQGLLPGEWIRDLKRCIWQGTREKVTARRSLPDGREGLEEIADPAGLYAAISSPSTSAAIGYLTDIGRTEENLAVIRDFLAGLTLLCAECTFLAADEEKARASHHLCSTDLNELAAELAPRYLLPMHLSKSYLQRVSDLYGELRPPSGTVVLPLPKHLVPPPLIVEQVADRLRPPD